MKRQQGLAVALLVATAVIVVGIHAGWWRFSGTLGGLRLNHLLGVVGAVYVLVSIPLYALLRRQLPQFQLRLETLEVFGNLAAFILVSIHFAQQTSRSPLPALGTGILAYVLLTILVLAGIVWRLTATGTAKIWRLLYIGALLALYVDVTFHALKNLGLV